MDGVDGTDEEVVEVSVEEEGRMFPENVPQERPYHVLCFGRQAEPLFA